MTKVIRVENLSKQYRLGQIGTGSLLHDLNRWWHVVRGKENPYLKIGEMNDRTSKGKCDYVWSLKDVSFDINQGDSVGIIGRNGAGKSTLLKILSRVTAPTTGALGLKGRIASLLEVGTGFHPDLSGRENIYLNGAILGMRRQEIRKKFDEIVDFAGVERYIDTPVKRYSSGMYVRLAFAVAAHLESEILIVDEVLAVGDAEFQKKCLGKMGQVSKGEGRTVLFVSHQISSVKSLCNKGIFLRNGTLQQEGPIDKVIDCYLKDGEKKSNLKVYDAFLKYVKMEQKGAVLTLEAAYDCPFGLDIPNLGFIVYNSNHQPVFGSNPTLELIPDDQYKRGTKRGRISIEIKSPKLIDGRYYASIWFGDSKENFIEDHYCLTFEVSDMTGKKSHPQIISGNVIPETEWVFQDL
ncbi:ABC transporter ATP-binding protein [Paraflavisolibacter sp. H34]|uniref:ABC transporter ATP-binding protein n=1 Tax=Huijunlia imazamoxiresistens TaxID=3127457 RepID=UPI0030172416